MKAYKDKVIDDFEEMQNIYYLQVNDSLEDLVNIYFDLNMPIFELLNYNDTAFHCKELCLEHLIENEDDDEMIFELINDLLANMRC